MSENVDFWNIILHKIQEINVINNDYVSNYHDLVITSIEECKNDEDIKKNILCNLKKLWNYYSLKDDFTLMSDFEPILQRDEHYRDHFIHAYNVFLLGYYLINKIVESDTYRQLFMKPIWNDSTVVSDYNFIWMIASTYHDFAYPIQNINIWINDLLKVFLGNEPNIHISTNSSLPPIYDIYMNKMMEYHSTGNANPDKTDLYVIWYKIYKCNDFYIF